MADGKRKLTPLLKASAQQDTRLFGAGADQQYSPQEIAALPAAVAVDKKVWKNADVWARQKLVNQRVELVAQEFGPENEQRSVMLDNLTELAKRYPQADPDLLIGLASGVVSALPDSNTGQPESDQGKLEMAQYDEIVLADVLSRINDGNFGATAAAPVPTVDNGQEPAGGLTALTNPTVGGLAGMRIGGSDLVDPATQQVAPAPEEEEPGGIAGFVRDFVDPTNVKEAFNTGNNLLRAIPEMFNAASETSAGNEQLAAELTRRGDLTVEQAEELFGTRGLPWMSDAAAADPLSQSLRVAGRLTTDIDPATLVNAKTSPTDETIPLGDLSYEQVQQMWRQHLIDTEQITPEGDRSFGNITGRTTLGRQVRDDVVGQGGWFGGMPVEQDKKREALAMRQSDVRTFEEREAYRVATEAKVASLKAAGIEASLDEVTRMRQARTWTEGRAFTRYLGQKGAPAMSPGSFGEMIVSGVVDMAATLGTDPTTYVPLSAPAGSGKAALNALSRGRLYAADKAMNAPADLINVGEELVWAKEGADRVLRNMAGQNVANSPRLTRRSFHYETTAGHQVRRNGSRWEVHTPKRIAGDPAELALPLPTFRTKKEAEESLALPLSKVELWDEAGNSGPGKRLSELEEEQRLEYTRATGNYTRDVTTNRAFWDYITTTAQGAGVVDALRNETSGYTIWLKSGQKFTAEMCERLARAQSGAEVRAILAQGVGPDLREASALASFTGVRGAYTNGKVRLASSKFTKNLYRWGQLAPNGQPVDLADQDDIVRSAHRLGVAAGMTPEELQAGMDTLFSYGTGATAGKFLLEDFMENVFFANLRQAGVRPERVNSLRGLIRKEGGVKVPPVKDKIARSGVASDWEQVAANALETRYAGGVLLDTRVADGQFLKGVDDEASLVAHETFASHVILPTARQLRRDTTRIAKIMRKGQWSDRAYERAATIGSQIMDRWRSLTLMSVPYLMRSIGEEMFSQAIMGRGGALHNPVAWLGQAVMLHHMFETASGFKKLSKAVNAARAATGAHRRAIVRPDEYRGAVMIETQDALNSLGIDRTATFSTAVGRSGRDVGWDKFERQTRSGIINPIIVEVDSDTQRVKVADGVKRLLAADRNDLDSVPIIIRPGKVTDTEGTEWSNTFLSMHGTEADEVFSGSRDLTHDLLFRKSSVRGDIVDVVEQARAAVEDTVAHRLGMGYVAPWMSRTYARLNGETWAADIERAVRTGDNAALSQKFRMLTYAQGSAMLDEHPNKMNFATAKTVSLQFDQATGKIDWESPESLGFLNAHADRLADIGSIREVRDILSGAKTIDDLVAETLDDPKKVDTVLAQMNEATQYSVGNRTRFPEGMSRDDMVAFYDNERRADLESAVRSYYQDIINNVSEHTGKNMSPRVREAVRTGQWAGKPLGQQNRKFVAMLRDELDNNPDFLQSVPPVIGGVEDPVRNKWGQIWTQKFFESVGNVRDMATLHPLIRQEYVNEVRKLAPYMTPEAHAEQLRWVRALGDKQLTKALEDARPNPNGWLESEDVDMLADKGTRAVVEDTFYNAVNRQNWAVALRWAAPFAQAAASSTRRWGKGMLTDPIATYRTVRNIEALQAATGEWTSDNDDLGGIRETGMLEGFVDVNEYGEEVFIYPAFGTLASVASGLFNRQSDPVAATASTKTVDVFGGGLFGAMGSPTISLALSMTPLRDLEARSDMVGDVVRFLQPYGVKQEGNIAQRLESAFIPAKWVGSVLNNDKMINDMSKAILVSRLSSGYYGPVSEWTEDTSIQIRNDVNSDARTLVWMESVGKLLLPALGGFDFNPLVEMPQGMKIEGIPDGKEGVQYLLPHMLKGEYDRYMEGAEGDTYALRQATFIKDWGEFALLMNYGTTKSSSDIAYSSTEAAKFAREEPDLYSRYRESIGIMLPLGDWDAEYDAFDRMLTSQDKANKVRVERNTAEQWNFLRQKALAFQKGQERADLVRAGASDAEIREMNKKYDDLGLTFADTGYVARHLQNLRTMLQDDAVLTAVPSAKYVKQYIEMRDKAWDALNQRNIASFSSDDAWNTPEVAWLYSTGMKAAADDPGFRNFWEQIAAQEFEKDD